MAYLFIDVQHGLCNRLRAMASAAVIAQSTGRDLVVIWRPDHHCDAPIEALLRYDGAVIAGDAAELMQSRAKRIYNYMEIEAGAQFQESVLAGDVPNSTDVYVRSAYTLTSPHHDEAAESRFLRNLRPSEPVLELINQVQHPSDVAVHIRMATGPGFDHLSYESPENWPPERHAELIEWRKRSDVSRFIDRLDALLAAGEIDTIFAAADLPATYAALIERYGSRVRYLKRTLYDRSALQLQYGLADLMLLTAAPLFLRSTWSSFSDVAQRLALPTRRFEKSGLDF